MTIYGVDDVDPDKLEHPFAALADSPEEWRGIFANSLRSIRTFLAVHDGAEVLAKCLHQALVSAASKKENPRWVMEDYEPYELIEPAELEIVQALALMQLSPRKGIPASPGSIYRFLSEIPKCTYAFSHMQPIRYPDDPKREHLIGKIRMQTMVHRNLFAKEDCEAVVQSIFRYVDDLSNQRIWLCVFGDVFELDHHCREDRTPLQ